MFSQSNSFLGGGNTARPGVGQYGQQQSFSGYQQPPQQQNGFGSQPTGFGGGPMQPQATGFPGYGQPSNFQAPQQQPAFTGYPQNQAPPQQSYQPPPQPQQQQQQQQQQPQPTAAPLRPQQTSSQIAQSFQTSSAPPPTPPKAGKSNKIPNIRLSFITATDQAKFEQLFKSAVGDNQALDGRVPN
ncbi:MAG: hypothetical protein Q9227_008995 [Pyrenula ochraceoflavens]